MSIPEDGDETINPHVADVAADVERQFGRYFTPVEGHKPFEVDAGFGDQGVVTGATPQGTFTFVRWRWQGRHTGTVGRFDGERPDDDPDRPFRYVMARGTGNQVTVEGLTVLEERADGVYARRFIDWLSVYSQMGIITPGRPIARTSTKLSDPPAREDLPEPRDRLPEVDPPVAKTAASAP